MIGHSLPKQHSNDSNMRSLLLLISACIAICFARPAKADNIVIFVIGDSLSGGYCSLASPNETISTTPSGWSIAASKVNGSWAENKIQCSPAQFTRLYFAPQRYSYPVLYAPGVLWYNVNDHQGFESTEDPCNSSGNYQPSLVYGLAVALEGQFPGDDFFFIQLSVGGSYISLSTTSGAHCWDEGLTTSSTQANLLEIFWLHHALPCMNQLHTASGPFEFGGLVSSIGGGQLGDPGIAYIGDYDAEMDNIRTRIGNLLGLQDGDYDEWPHIQLGWHSPAASPYNTGSPTRSSQLRTEQTAWDGLSRNNSLVPFTTVEAVIDTYGESVDNIHFLPETTMYLGYEAGLELIAAWYPLTIDNSPAQISQTY